jgi:nicotinamidase-related amidase
VRAGTRDLHGNAPDKSSAALLIIDMINDMEFPEGDQLMAYALPVARRLVELKRRAREADIPAVYVNDNFGRWRSDFNAQVDHCLRDGVRGREIAALLTPKADDYFVLKPKHSGFYLTTLEVLLDHLAVDTVIVTGVAGNICVLFTANDAYMRDYSLVVPADCVASNTLEENDAAIDQMGKVLKAATDPSDRLDLAALTRPRGARRAGRVR